VKRLEFSAKVKDQAAQRANGHCEKCNLPFGGRRPEYHHILECAYGGKPTLSNCLCICAPCHKVFTAGGIKTIRKSDRQRRKSVGAEREKAKIPQRAKPEKTAPRFDKTPMPRRDIYRSIEE
jgi:5-methylcytosine-specific restriction enzyme A